MLLSTLLILLGPGLNPLHHTRALSSRTPAALTTCPRDALTQVLLLENVRWHPEEEKNDPAFAKQLAEGAQHALAGRSWRRAPPAAQLAVARRRGAEAAAAGRRRPLPCPSHSPARSPLPRHLAKAATSM